MEELIYTEHMAGTFEDGLQVCKLCGKILTDYTGDWISPDRGATLQGWPEGPLYVCGGMSTIVKPEENYGGEDPYKRKVIKCI